LAFCFAGGISVLGLAAADLWKERNADSLFLALWVFGTFIFAAFLNWTINARSVLPLIPAAGILLARRLDARSVSNVMKFPRLLIIIIPLILSGVVSLAVAGADANLAASARKAADFIHGQSFAGSGNLFFEGHWGFQYYMQSYGAQPVDVRSFRFTPGIVIVIPENNTNIFGMPPGVPTSRQLLEVKTNPWIATMHAELGAGFYASVWGPLPFAFGAAPPERYQIVTLLPPSSPSPLKP
jgi:hypothetical protein